MILVTIIVSILLINIIADNSNEVTIETACCGEIKAKVFGPDNGIPVIAVHGAKLTLLDEWVNVAAKLGSEGYRVCLPNFFTHKTKPGILTSADFDSIVRDSITRGYFNVDKAVVMGKSWGGANTANYAVKNSNYITKLVLVAPANNADKALIELSNIDIKVLLLWAFDDQIMPEKRAEEWKASLGTQLTYYNVATGGHQIFDEYADVITNFIKN